MIDYDENIYDYPEKHGLTLVEAIDDPDACYSFGIFALWRHEDGRLFYAQDSGCSCPSPFETYDSLNDLTELTNNSWKDFEKAVNEWQDYNTTYEGRVRDETLMCRHEMMMAGAKALAASD